MAKASLPVLRVRCCHRCSGGPFGSTGELPRSEQVEDLVTEACKRYRSNLHGAVTDNVFPRWRMHHRSGLGSRLSAPEVSDFGEVGLGGMVSTIGRP